MSILEGLRLAVNGLLSNRLRSALTMLGILIGVSAVILLVGVGNGASVAVQQQIQSLGSNLLTVFPSNARGAGGVQQGFGTGSTLTLDDVKAIANRQSSPDVVTAIPSAGGRAQLTFGNQNWNSSLTGTTQDFPSVRNYQLASGQFFTAADVDASSKVAVIGQTVVTNLFNDQDPIGQVVKINRQSFRVIGVLTLMQAAIPGNSLVVGSIGIRNIMLVTVTERTREIGIRKAIGARRRDILMQFLIESMFLAGLGGALGILVGFGLSRILPLAVSSLPTPIISMPSVFLAFGISVGIGLFFGLYPANRAARLRPIEALRYE